MYRRSVKTRLLKEALTQVRKQRRAANQRAFMARRKNEQLELEIAFLRILNRCLLYQIRTISNRLDVAIHMLQDLGLDLG